MKHCLIILVLSLLCVGMVGCTHSGSTANDQTPSQKADKALEELNLGTKMLNEGKFQGAEKHLKLALEVDTYSGLARNNLGNVYYQQGRYYDAAWQYQFAARLLPKNPEPPNNLGLVLEASNKLDDAIAQYEKAVALQPNNMQYMGNLARARICRGNRDDVTRKLLEDLIVIETRPTWREWEQRELAFWPKSNTPATNPYTTP